MLSLKSLPVLGEGNDRRVYRHPEDASRCIKVPRYPERGSEQNEREKHYFSRLVWRIKCWDHVPCYYGTVLTDQGEGLVHDLIMDDDGSTSRTIRQYRQSDTSTLVRQDFRDQLLSLGKYLEECWIVPSDLNDRNIVCQRTHGELRLWLIDGISNPSLIPLATYWPWFARRKVRRHFNRFLDKLVGYELLSEAMADSMKLHA